MAHQAKNEPEFEPPQVLQPERASEHPLKVPLLELRPKGLYCAAGDFYIDPWTAVERAVITHAHSDHARPGSQAYLCAAPGHAVLAARLGPQASIQSVPYGQPVNFDQTTVTLFPAGHILGSAQIKIEHQGYTWVVSGDYKLDPDPTCTPFEPVRCHGFITEATFGLPIYRWAPDALTFAAINEWWRHNQSLRRASVLYGYSLGKAQRLLAGVDPSLGPIYTHNAVEPLNQLYRAAGVPLPPTASALAAKDFSQALILAPPSADGPTWLRRFGDCSTAIASGWMQLRGHRRRNSVDRGFVLSDHADWPSLLRAIAATGAETVWVTHGSIDPLVRYLNENGTPAAGLNTRSPNEPPEAE